MAIASLRRLPLHLSCSYPALSPFPRTIARSSTTTTTTTTTTSSAKVADRIVKLSAIDPDGNKKSIIGLSNQTLLRALINAGLIDPASHRMEEIDACSAECEVHIAQEWLERLPPASYEEKYVLTRASRNRVLNKHARLGCQVVLNHDLQGSTRSRLAWGITYPSFRLPLLMPSLWRP